MSRLERVEKVLKDMRERKKLYSSGRSEDDDRIATMKRRIDDLERKIDEYDGRFFELERRFEGQQEALTIMAAILEQKGIDASGEIIKPDHNRDQSPISHESDHGNREDRDDWSGSEWQRELQERRDRERNIVVKGITKSGWHARMEVEVGIKSVCRGSVEIDDVWITAETADGTMVVVRLKSKEDKERVKAEVKGLQELGWTIFDDQTFIERRTRNALINKRRQLQSDGGEWTIEGNKLIGDSEIWIWKEMEGQFEVKNLREPTRNNSAREGRMRSWDRESERSRSIDFKRRRMD